MRSPKAPRRRAVIFRSHGPVSYTHLNHIGVHCVDFRDNVLKLAVAHMGVNLRFRFYLCVAETECLDRKLQIVAMPVGAAERQLFPERGFVNLNNTDACSFQFQNLFPDCKADLCLLYTSRNQTGKIYSESATIRDSSSQCGVCSCGWYGS